MLVDRLGADAIAAVDPSSPFVDALALRLPGVDVHQAMAEQLPFADDTFDVVVAQLVVQFMADPVGGLREMARVGRPGATVAASVWDSVGRTGPLSLFWDAATSLDPEAPDEAGAAGSGDGDLARLATAAGLVETRSTVLTVRRRFEDVEEWWEPFTYGVGPAGAYLSRLGPDDRERLHARCAELLPPAPFDLSASAWCMTARVAPDPSVETGDG